MGSQQAATDCINNQGPGFRFKPSVADTASAAEQAASLNGMSATSNIACHNWPATGQRGPCHSTCVQQRLAQLQPVLSKFMNPASASAGGTHTPSICKCAATHGAQRRRSATPPQLVLHRSAPSQQLPEHCTCVCRKNPYFTNLHPVKQLHYSEDGIPSAEATPLEWTEEGVSVAL